jgi:hypothetical protein
MSVNAITSSVDRPPAADSPSVNPVSRREPGLDHDRLIGDRARVYQQEFGLRTIRLQHGNTLAVLVGRTAGLMMPRAMAREVRSMLDTKCGPVFTDCRSTWVFLVQGASPDVDIAEMTMDLYRRHGVMALASPGLVISLPTPGDPRRCWIQPPNGELPTFSGTVRALTEIAGRGGGR